MEYREFRAESVTVDDEGKLHGVAVPFNRETVIGDLSRGGWHEEVADGSCKKSIQEGDIVFLAHHDMHMPLARTSAGNLELREESDSLHWEADPVDTSYGRDIRALAKAKVLGGVSIGFKPVKEEWRDANGNPSDRHSGTHRILREIKLIEISAVTNPAYKDTSIMARDELLAERETRAAKATYADLETCGECGATGQYGAYCSACGKSMKNAKPAGDYCTSCGSKLDGKRSHDCDPEGRASSVSAADRKKDASAGHALPDGSYPIPDLAHLHAAAILAASHHGDWKAAQALIRRRARELGVNVESLPGFNHDLESKCEACDSDECIVRQAKDLELNSSIQEPDASTPDSEGDDIALRAIAARQRSRDLGFI